MYSENQAYFDKIEPLYNMLQPDPASTDMVMDVSSLTTLTLSEIKTLASFFKPVTTTSLYRMLNLLWLTCTGKELDYLLDKPQVTAFCITTQQGQFNASVTTANCGVYKLSVALTGNAQRFYLYRILSKLNVDIQPHEHVDEDICMQYDGHTITLTTGPAALAQC